MQLTVMAAVIRERSIGEDDRLLTLLTQDLGVIGAYVKGARKIKGKLLSSVGLLSYSRFVLFKSKDRYIVDSADAERVFFGIRQDIERLSLASWFAQLLAQLVHENEPSGEYLRLFLNTLHLLEEARLPIWHIKPVFELRVLSMAGYMPDLVACRECGCFESDVMHLLPVSGELICDACVGEAIPDGAVLIEPGILAAMRHILYSPPGRIFSFRLTSDKLQRLSDITEQYLHCQLERSFPTLEFFHTLF